MKVMFMGTPDIAAAFLEETAKHYEVVCCVTQPDKPKGRGHEPAPLCGGVPCRQLGY